MEIKNLNFHINFKAIEDLKKATASKNDINDLELIANNIGIEQVSFEDGLHQAVG